MEELKVQKSPFEINETCLPLVVYYVNEAQIANFAVMLLTKNELISSLTEADAHINHQVKI